MIEFIGPLPKPIHGFSWVNQQVFLRLSEKSVVRIRDRAKPRLGAGLAVKLLGLGVAVCQIVSFLFGLIVSRPKSVYLGCSGGLGLVVDSAFILMARIFAVPVYIHHHAFTYLNAPNVLMRFLLARFRNCEHIVLCGCMAEKLALEHDIPVGNIFVLSNAAFVERADLASQKKSRVLKVGFLSNITAEKGVFDFFALAAKFSDRSERFEFIIAGPVDESIKDMFFTCLASAENVSHIGPVYGVDKLNFYANIDILSFPTKYPNEAQPVTIIEAYRAGVPVIANQRGCIASMIDANCGLVVQMPERYVDEAGLLLEQFLADRSLLSRLQTGARLRYEHESDIYGVKLNLMIDCIVSGSSLRKAFA